MEVPRVDNLDEVSNDLDYGEEQMLLLGSPFGLRAERTSWKAEGRDIVLVLESAPHQLDVLVQLLGVRIVEELFQ